MELGNHLENYFKNLEDKVQTAYSRANDCRKKNLDPEPFVELYLAEDVASRVEGLVGPKGIAKRIRELESRGIEREDIAFKIAGEIAEGKFFESTPDEMIDKALRASLALMTEGITAAPIEGISKVRIKQNDDGSDYLAVYYAGPIRSAGGTASGVSVLIADYVRRKKKLSRYRASDKEISRMIEEVQLYNKVVHLQIPTTDEMIALAVKNLPVEISGEPTEKQEVTGYRDIKRIETNQLRGGACLVLNDGITGRAVKILKKVNRIQMKGWDWLDDINELTHIQANIENKKKTIIPAPVDGYIKDVIAGRPIFAHPSRKGGFRLRYGRSRATGLAAVGCHPATMGIVNDFIATGTHVRTERPGKGSILMPVDTILPPIVRLKNGDVLEVNSYDHALEIRNKIDKILFMGDMLVGVGEFLQNNYNLEPAGYCEEWWVQELEEAMHLNENGFAEEIWNQVERIIDDPLHIKPSAELAIELSKNLKIPLHPKFTYFWNGISGSEFNNLVNFANEHFQIASGKHTTLAFPYNDTVKKILDKICIPQTIKGELIYFNDHSLPLIECLGLGRNVKNPNLNLSTTIEIITQMTGIALREKVPCYLGARMGRPEKAKHRTMKPAVHSLFPIGKEGGRTRSIKEAISKGKAFVDIVDRRCNNNHETTFHSICPVCEERTEPILRCKKCNIEAKAETCPACGATTNAARRREIDLKWIHSDARKKIGIFPDHIKGIKGLTNSNKIPELLHKGILRAKHDVFVFRDGTTRFDATDAPITHFKPMEIGTSVKKLREMGYRYDINGEKLTHEEQIVEIMIQDIIVNFDCGIYSVKVGRYVDELMTSVYGEEAYYNFKSVQDVIGHLVVGLAPHTSAGIIGRIIGFTKAKIILAHPFWHAAKRRNCDSDEDGVILLMDAFLNFSKHFLSSSRGSQMDTPLILVSRLNPSEVDDESHNIETVSSYPLSFYSSTLTGAHPKSIVHLLDIYEGRLNSPYVYHGSSYSHDTSLIHQGPPETAYKSLGAMSNKLDEQLLVAKLIEAVDLEDVALRVIEKHFIPDLIGNLRAYGTQKIRCVRCNTIYRRVPLSGQCSSCDDGGKLILTVFPKSVTKYYESTMELIAKYNLSDYLVSRLENFEINTNVLFSGKREVKKIDLTDFM